MSHSASEFLALFDPAVLWQILVAAFSPWIRLLRCWRPPPKPPEHKAKALDVKQTQVEKRRNRLTLRRYLRMAAMLPSMTSANGLHALQPNISGSRNPKKILNSARLKGINLEALQRNITQSSHLALLTLPNGERTIPLLIDTGASACTSPCISDFEPGTLKDLPTPQTMRGIGGNVCIKQIGMLRYETVDDHGAPFVFRCPGFYIPDLDQRLFSPQIFFMTGGKGGELIVRHDHVKLRMQSGPVISLPLDPASRLFYVHCVQSVQRQADSLAHSLHLTQESNQNLTRGQKRLLRWHHALVHVGFATIRRIGKLGWLGSQGLELGDPKVDPPMCGTCQYAKAAKRPTKATNTRQSASKEGAISKDKLIPGQLVSMDHMIIKEFGRTFDSMGRESQDKMYQAATIFHDAASGHVCVQFQRGLSASETLKSKMEYERERLTAGVRVQAYRTDNGTFTAQTIIEHIRTMDQQISFSGAGAQHQNALAERAIKTVTDDTRSVLLHAALRWPEAYDPSEWPMAMAYCLDIRNSLPKGESDFSPDEILSQAQSNHSRLMNARAWGCPAYVLDPKLRNDGKLPKFQPKARRGKFMGFSPVHSSTVGLIRNLRSGSITPQFHVVYDSEFETTYAPDGEPPDAWRELIINHRYQTPLDEDFPIQLTEEWLTPEEVASRQDKERARVHAPPPSIPSVPEIADEPVPQITEPIARQDVLSRPALEGTKTKPNNLVVESQSPTSIKIEPPPAPTRIHNEAPAPTPPPEPPPVVLRRSKRVRSKPQRYLETESSNYADLLSNELFAHSARACYTAPYSRVDHEYLSFLLQDWNNGFQEGIIPHDFFAFKAKKGNDPDMPTFHQAMSSSEREFWIAAIEAELHDLELRKTWLEMDKNDLPEGANVVPGTWAFKVKRYPDGRFRKFKARFCVRGDKQLEGVDFFKTYAPVVSWISVRTCLILSAILNLKTVQADYSNAFAQAYLEEEIYLKLPHGCTGKYGSNTVLKLQRSLYGLRQAAACWFDKLRDGLLSNGWTQPLANLEHCLFTKDKIICLVYVDDCLFFGADETKIRALIREIESAGFALTVEKDVYAFLGVEVSFDVKSGAVTLTQPGLIQKIVKMAALEHANSKGTPADRDPLGPGTDADPMHAEDWSYAAMIGCLMYLGNNTRPDIQYAVHACARYTHRPRDIHSRAVKRIIRYLIGTADKGIVFRPTKNVTIDMYVDADFAGMWNATAEEQDPVRVKSRTGYIIMLAGCPLLWCSKLQTEIATSTLEAEFVALSSAMRDLLPTREIFQAVGKSMGLAVPDGASLRSTVFEDNNGCLTLATVPKMTPRTKHIGVKYFWFRSKVGPATGIEIVKVDTKDQLADVFTKGLNLDQFTTLRSQMMGWVGSVREGVSQYETYQTLSRLMISLWTHRFNDGASSTTSHGASTTTNLQDSWCRT